MRTYDANLSVLSLISYWILKKKQITIQHPFTIFFFGNPLTHLYYLLLHKLELFPNLDKKKRKTNKKREKVRQRKKNFNGLVVVKTNNSLVNPTIYW